MIKTMLLFALFAAIACVFATWATPQVVAHSTSLATYHTPATFPVAMSGQSIVWLAIVLMVVGLSKPAWGH